MPPKAKKSTSPAAAPNGKAPAAASPSQPAAQDEPVEIKTLAGGKPDQAAYHAEQDKIKAEIDAIQTKLNAVKEKISLAGKGPGNDRRTAIRAEMDEIRSKQSNGKASRGKLFDQLKAIQDGVQKKDKELQAARQKTPYKTVAEVDAQIKHLEKQIESGNLKLGDEKRAIQEISTLKRSRKTVEGFQAEQEAIKADRARADEIRKQLDDPESKAISDRFEVLKNELDELKKESDEAYAGRNKLFEERNALSEQLNTLYARKRESASKYKEASDRYWQKVQEERARRAERLKAQRQAEEDAKRKEEAERILEEARIPAFQSKIEDCQTLIDYFNAKIAGGSAPVPEPKTLSSQKSSDVAGVPKLEIRQVEQPSGEGLIQRKKKHEDEESYFVGGKGKGKKGGKAAPKDSNQLNIPFATLSALLDLSIPPPASSAELPRAVEDLKMKKAWFEANQDRVTAENVAKAEARIKKLTKGDANGQATEIPHEPNSTPADSKPALDAVPVDAVDEKLESVKETDEAPAAVEATVSG